MCFRPPLAAAITLLIAGAASAHTGVVRGRVIDSASAVGRPGVTVIIDSSRSTAVTTSSGQFLIARVTAGPHRLRARGIGIAEAIRSIEVRPGETTFVDIAVTAIAQQLDAMRVDAAAAE